MKKLGLFLVGVLSLSNISSCRHNEHKLMYQLCKRKKQQTVIKGYF